MRPRSLDEVIGQEHVLGAGAALRSAIESGKPHSAILYGPPGAGKTTLARIAAAGAQGAFEEESAVNAGKAEIRGVIERARERRRANGRPTILFLDEIHRFNKAQQDALLPAVEDGTLTLIGATTENPYFEVNSALLSRCQLFELQPLDRDDLAGVVRRGETELAITLPDEIRDEIVAAAGGDARNALNILEAAVAAAAGEPVSSDNVHDAARKRPLRYDKGGDHHYDVTSAFIKSMRGSDADAAIYYLAVMIAGGEDPKF
ncbi:MAG TPA: AAA family ATPase, partial [Solirubrobacterales bacterium]|nr:AAA family ATPase [Solirubrobacterales bacterium]